ncbi:MAG: hypothetical protein GDA50_05265 [Alphaproteobacteria bacterium GM202ARS2]|nr:hypothetical protein [Alphaproteobacteria bacterium GM202ARS2]
MNGLNDTLRAFADVVDLPPFEVQGESTVALQFEKGGKLFIERIADNQILMYFCIEEKSVSMGDYLRVLGCCHPRRRLSVPLSFGMVRDSTYLCFARVAETSLSLPILEEIIAQLLRLAQVLQE